MEKLRMRMATTADAAAIQAIYAPYVADTVISFETVPPTVEDMAGRIGAILATYPYIVGIRGGRIIGYAYAGRQMERAAYQWNATLSVYLDKEQVGSGCGSRLYRALLSILELQNIRNVYGGVTSPNPRSERLHERFGFSAVGVYHRTGFKFGRWIDVAWYEKRLNESEGEPPPVIPVQALDARALQDIFTRVTE